MPKVGAEAPRAAPRGTLNEERWDEVLAAAAEVFVEKGYGQATVREIASRAGMLNQGSLYYYIQTKEDLLYALIERSYHRAVAATAEDAETAAAPAPDRLRAFIRRWVDEVILCDNFTIVVGREFRSLDAQRREALRPLGDHCERFVLGLLQAGVEEGHFDPALNLTASVMSILSLLNNSHRLVGAGGQISREDAMRWHITFILRGLAV